MNTAVRDASTFPESTARFSRATRLSVQYFFWLCASIDCFSTSRLAARHAFDGDRPQTPSPAKRARSWAPDLRGSLFVRWTIHSRRYGGARVEQSLHANNAQNEPHALGSLPLLRHCRNRRTQYRVHIRLSQLLWPPVE